VAPGRLCTSFAVSTNMERIEEWVCTGVPNRLHLSSGTPIENQSLAMNALLILVVVRAQMLDFYIMVKRRDC